MPAGLIILAAFILVPTIEIYTFVQVGSSIGALPTVLLTIATAVAGTIMLRQQGFSLLMRIRAETDAGRVPSNELMQGALIVVAALMLLIPGFVSDAIGLLLFVPPLRMLAAQALIRNVNVRGGVNFSSNGPTGYRKGSKNTVDLDEGEWHRNQDEQEQNNNREDGPRLGSSDSPWKDGNRD
ncbi:FxsA family protein [Polycladidibacter hongkongensis]|uniref:FxsA family protein n=1 Tax=Polycladidibacter hongkongensis TaxID=1647556 RepID=UPI00082BAD41|nr:FxsA family protein [Pseudovibrio hongkongensis]